ncbi:MAG: M23 family metallopeptidase [Treponema sp.]|jgi:murein DD-endopeptidase MepM/ murein hydrolase activator NlpD|nr:M23 family metallopeptidase [Treponema sp.]
MFQQPVKQRKYARAPIGEAPGKGSALYALQQYNLPIGANTNPLIQQVKQMSAAERSQKGVAVSRSYLPTSRTQSNTLPQRRAASQPSARKLRRHGLSLGLVVPILAIGGLTAFSIISLNWADASGQRAAALPWKAGAAMLEPGKDMGIGQNMESYAGLFLPDVEQSDANIPLNLMEKFSWEEYTVQPGDTISEIAQTHALSMDAVIASNSILDAKVLRIGQKLKIPSMEGIPYTVKPGDSFSKIVSATGVPLTAILDANDIQDEHLAVNTVLFIPGGKMGKEELNKALGLGAKPVATSVITSTSESFAWPIRGRLTSPYGWRDDPFNGVRTYHAALDLAAALGTPIKAALAGKVSSVGVNSVYGKFIIITHTNGFQTMYGHMSATSVKQGETVKKGTKIGEVGSTGRSTGPHLHLALYKNGRAVNPLEYLK